MAWTINWDIGATTLFDGIDNFEEYTKNALQEKMLEFAVRMQTYARENAPWNDRTGMARSGLDVDVEDAGDTIKISLFHTVDYGLFLELRWGGAYAIILPTIEALGPQLMQEFEDLISGIIYYE